MNIFVKLIMLIALHWFYRIRITVFEMKIFQIAGMYNHLQSTACTIAGCCMAPHQDPQVAGSYYSD